MNTLKYFNVYTNKQNTTKLLYKNNKRLDYMVVLEYLANSIVVSTMFLLVLYVALKIMSFIIRLFRI